MNGDKISIYNKINVILNQDNDDVPYFSDLSQFRNANVERY